MSATVVVGLQWGDEGKGRVVDELAAEYDIVVRFHGGANAGHSVTLDGTKYGLHLIPSGILRGKQSVITNGVVLDLEVLTAEKSNLEAHGFDVDGRLTISELAHLVMPYHKAVESAEEKRLGGKRIGTSMRGIGLTYEDKYARRGIRLADLRDEAAFRERLRDVVALKNALLQHVYGEESLDAGEIYDSVLRHYRPIAHLVGDTTSLLLDALAAHKAVMFEGAHGFLLDIDFGTYPYVTSSNCLAATVGSGAGINAGYVTQVIGVVKAYTSRVGQGPLLTTCDPETAERMRPLGGEWGTTTGRPRRIGWFDAPAVRQAIRVSGADRLALTHLDVLGVCDEIPVCTHYLRGGEPLGYIPTTVEALAECTPVYECMPGWHRPLECISRWEALPSEAQHYVRRIEELVGVSVGLITMGPERGVTIRR